eukprot:c26350_g1_i1 orf=79-4755(+)
MHGRSGKHDSLALSQHFKLCGFLRLAVSVEATRPQSSALGSVIDKASGVHCPSQISRSTHNGLQSAGGSSEGNSCCSEFAGSSFTSRSHDQCQLRSAQCSSCVSDVSERLSANTSNSEATCAVFRRRSSMLRKQSGSCPQTGTSFAHLDPRGPSAFAAAGALIGTECSLTGEGADVQLQTNRGFVLRAINSGRAQGVLDDSIYANQVKFASADSIQGCCSTTNSDWKTGVAARCSGLGERSYCAGDYEEHNWPSNNNLHLSASEQNAGNKPKPSLETQCPPAAGFISESDNISVTQNKDNFDGKPRKRVAYTSGSGDILHQLRLLTLRNCVEVQGHVLGVESRAADVRALVLLDIYLSSSLWSSCNYWKPSQIAAAVLNHVSCDWDTRRKYLVAIRQGQKPDSVDYDGLWNLGECEVVGCKLHFQATEETRRTRFDLHALFKSLPSLNKKENRYRATIIPGHHWDLCCHRSGIWDIPDELLASIFCKLLPRDLWSVASVCRHMRELAVPIMPCMNLKLFPHQQAAVQWMLQHELNPQSLLHPLYQDLQTEDGFHFYLNCISGDLSPDPPQIVMGIKGGLFCDEPGLGKTVTALSLILKTQGTLSEAPSGAQVRWCDHRSGDVYGYYEISSSPGTNLLKRCMDLKARRNRPGFSPPESVNCTNSLTGMRKRSKSYPSSGSSSSNRPGRLRSSDFGMASQNLNSVKRKLLEPDDEILKDRPEVHKPGSFFDTKQQGSAVLLNTALLDVKHAKLRKSNKGRAVLSDSCEDSDVWVQCDSCSKWRKLPEGSKPPEEGLAWFCNMNKDPLHQGCSDPEENWDDSGAIKSLPGFYKVGSSPGQPQNIAHFANVLKEYASVRDLETNAALTWLANLPPEKLAKMAYLGVAVPPGLGLMSVFGDDQHGYDKIFQKFGLVQKREGKGLKKWCYPQYLDNLVLDLPALREALNRPVDLTRMYLSRATLIVVPPNLVEHWKNQILRHTKPGQLRLYVWNEQKKPPQAQDLAWNYDVVITTFPRLSTEWSIRESSVLMSVHWLRIMLDEGHTLGSSLSLTNKLQMAVSMHASRRWLLTGTPTPNTPNSQVAHLQPMLKFLHEEVYGRHQKSWEGGILKPFEAGREEGRFRLLQLLQRCMISARKSDLCTLPPCVRKVTLLDFTQKHADSYNELVVTVRRNILMADWNDPSHVESLLNPKQWKFRSNTIRNVRLSCCVAGHIKVRNAGEDIQETMDILAQQGMDPMSLEFTVIRTALLYGGNCRRCNEWCRLPIVTPCRHLLCQDCVALDRERCTLAGCGHPYKMQSPEDLARPENPNPKWPVPQDLIELQPSYVQDNWDPDWQATSSSKVAYLVERLKTLHSCPVHGEDGADFVPDMDPCGSDCMKSGQYQRLQSLQKFSPEKAIVFSQFLEHINVIERQLTEAGIKVAGLYSPMHSMNKMKSLLSFQNDIDCTVLLMDGSAALGLDLSFVTHVFLMEPIWDRSMEEQVVSRAHRMGATRPVLVETLAMRGTIEEQMLQFLQDPAEHSRAFKQEAPSIFENGRSGYRTVHEFAESSYLARLSFVRTNSGS